MKNYIAIIIVVCVFFSGFSQEGKLNISPEEYGRLMQVGRDEGRKRFDIAGSVLDENGKLLDNVKMTVEKTKFVGFDKHEDSRDTNIISGKFEVKSGKQDSITLSFEKDGYYDEAVFISPHGHHAEIKNDVLEIKNLKIVLKKIGELAKLLKYKGTLQFNPSGKATVLSLMQKKDNDGNVIKHEKGDNYKEDYDKEELLIVKDIQIKDALPANCIYVVADPDESGKVKTKLFNDRYYTPETIRLFFSAPDSGFIVYKPKEEKVALIWRNMLKAPEEGYQKELVIGVAEKNEIFAQGKNLYFYFKTGGKYGKGCVKNVSYLYGEGDDDDEKSANKRGDGTLSIYIDLRLNPDGTRNLESLD